jgi:hypothetical protein
LLYDSIIKGFPQLAGAGVRAGLVGARAPLTHTGQGGEARGLRALGRELLDMLGWPDARRGSLLLEHLQRGSCRAPEPGGWPLLTEAEAFGSLGRREQFERLAGVVDLLGAASGPEGQPRAHANPFCCVYGPMSADTGCILLNYDLNEKSVSKRLSDLTANDSWVGFDEPQEMHDPCVVSCNN